MPDGNYNELGEFMGAMDDPGDGASQPSSTDFALSGSVTTSGLTATAGKLLGRYTASTGAVQEITVGSGLTLNTTTGILTSEGGGGSGDMTLDGTQTVTGPKTFEGSALRVQTVDGTDATRIQSFNNGLANEITFDNPDAPFTILKTTAHTIDGTTALGMAGDIFFDGTAYGLSGPTGAILNITTGTFTGTWSADQWQANRLIMLDGAIDGGLGISTDPNGGGTQPSHQFLVLGVNMRDSTTGFVPLDSSMAAFGLVLERDFWTGNTVQHEAYFTDGKSARPIQINHAEALTAPVNSIVAGTVTIGTPQANDYLRVGLKFKFTTLSGVSQGAGTLAIDTWYEVVTLPTESTFTFRPYGGGTIVTGSADSGTMQRGGYSGMSIASSVQIEPTNLDHPDALDAQMGLINPTAGGFARLILDDRGNGASGSSSIFFKLNNAENWRIGTNVAGGSATDFYIHDVTGGGGGYAFQLQSGGQLALGYPAYHDAASALDVNGTVTATGLTILNGVTTVMNVSAGGLITSNGITIPLGYTATFNGNTSIGDGGLGFTETGATATRYALFGSASTAITGGGTISLGGYTLTVPSTGTAVTTTTINNGTLPVSGTTLAGTSSATLGVFSTTSGSVVFRTAGHASFTTTLQAATPTASYTVSLLPTGNVTMTLPSTSFTAARSDAGQTFTATSGAKNIFAGSGTTVQFDTGVTFTYGIQAGAFAVVSGGGGPTSPVLTTYALSQTGIYSASTNTLDFTTGGVRKGGFSATGAFDLVGNLITTPVAQTATTAAVSVTAVTTALTTTAPAQAITLADGTNGQIKIIAHVASSGGGTAILTPTTKTGYTTITFAAVGDTVTLQFFTTVGWLVMGSRGVAIA